MKKYLFTPDKFSRKSNAFTLIEILVVIAILAILMGITSQIIGGVSESQGRARAKTDMALMASGLEAFYGMYGDYPRLNAGGSEVFAAGELYKCLVGKMMLHVTDGQIMMVETSQQRQPFLDASKLRINDPNDPEIGDVDPEKNGVYFSDPWGEPYLYFYDTSTVQGGDLSSTWRSPSFILLSKGPDKKAADSLSMYTTGIMPDTDDYTSNEANFDNIIEGRDD